jgi:hypothetical protein
MTSEMEDEPEKQMSSSRNDLGRGSTGALSDLIARVEKATGPDLGLNLAIGKAIDGVPPDAEWKRPDEDSPSWHFAAMRGEWERPGYRAAYDAYRASIRAYIRTSPTDRDEIARWHEANPPPYEAPEWRETRATGLIPAYTASLDAALALCERVLPGYRPELFRLLDTAGWGAHFRQPVTETAYAPTPALALCLAILKALADAAAQPRAEPDLSPSPGRT